MRNRFDKTFFKSSAHQQLTLNEFEKTIASMFDSQNALAQMLKSYNNQRKNLVIIQLKQIVKIVLSGLVTVFAFSMVSLTLINRLNRVKRNGQYIGFDTNYNGIVNEPGEEEQGSYINKLTGLSIIIFFITGMLAILAHLYLDKRKITTLKDVDSDYENSRRAMDELLTQLESSIDNLSENDKADLPLDHFICPISHVLIRNPLEVWVDQPLSNGQIAKKAIVYDCNSFMKYAEMELNGLNKSILTEPTTTLPVKNIKFSAVLNQQYQNHLKIFFDKINAPNLNAAISFN